MVVCVHLSCRVGGLICRGDAGEGVSPLWGSFAFYLSYREGGLQESLIVYVAFLPSEPEATLIHANGHRVSGLHRAERL